MKKTRLFSLLLALMTAITVITGCGKSAVVGKWKMIEMDGRPVSDSFYMDFHSDGTGNMIDDGGSTRSFQWSYSGNKVTVSYGGDKLEFTVKGKRMTYGEGDFDTGVFEKQ